MKVPFFAAHTRVSFASITCDNVGAYLRRMITSVTNTAHLPATSQLNEVHTAIALCVANFGAVDVSVGGSTADVCPFLAFSSPSFCLPFPPQTWPSRLPLPCPPPPPTSSAFPGNTFPARFSWTASAARERICSIPSASSLITLALTMDSRATKEI